MKNNNIEYIKDPDKIINYWKKEKLVVALIVVFGLTFNGSMVLGPIVQGRLIDSLVKVSATGEILRLAVFYASVIGAIQVLRYFKRFYIRCFANSTSASMRLMIYNNIMHKKASELDREDIGNLMTRAVSDVDLCVEGMRKFTTEVFDTGVVMISYAVAMVLYDARITLYACVFIPLAMLLAEKLKTRIYKYSADFRIKSSEVAGITYDMVENAMLYRVNGLEGINRSNYATELSDLQEKATKAHLLENSMQPVYNAVAMLGSAVVIYMGGVKVIAGGWTLGQFIAFMTMFAAMAVKASKAAKLFNSVQKSQISWKRIKPYLSDYISKDESKELDYRNTELIVEGLSFSYPCGEGMVIEDISFQGKMGDIIGITGPVASGKSTLGMALLGQYPYLGSIRIDGRELSCYSEYERSCMISYLGHQPQLLSDTIYENITLGNEADIAEVLADVCLEDDLAAMPQGQGTLVGNGGIRLSGGQQARLALARALLNKSKIIILDDPFSAVDMKTEERIIENLRRNYKQSLIILISHRLSIFKTIDRILLLKSDKSCQWGSHQELMDTSELYAEIFDLQCKEGGDENGR